MARTRSKTRSDARHAAFKRSYQGLTPSQQAIARHNRFLTRVWKIPWDKRQQHRTCVACLEDLLTGPQRSHMVIMACDHPIHMDCLVQHAFAYMDRQNLTFSAEELDAMPMDVWSWVSSRSAGCLRVAALHAPPAACRFRCGICACLNESRLGKLDGDKLCE